MDDGSDPGNAPASPGRPARPRVALAAKLAVAAASLAASLIAVELVYRAFRRGLYQARVGEWGTDLYRLEPPPRYYSCLPDLDLTATFAHEHGESRATYRTDGDGWRRQPEVAVGAATRRVVCLGDSYTFGIAVDDDGTHPWQLQQILRAEGIDAKVSNCGVPGYNSVQQYHTLREAFEALAPDVVVLGYVVNDAEPVMTVTLPPDEFFKHCSSWLLEIAKPTIDRMARALVTDHPLCRSLQQHAVAEYRRSFAWDSRKWRDSRDALAELHEFLRARGVPFLVFVLPDFTQRFDATYAFTLLHERVQEWGAQAGYPVFDLLPDFLGEDHRELWVPGEGHPNQEAQRRFAAAIAEQVARVLE